MVCLIQQSQITQESYILAADRLQLKLLANLWLKHVKNIILHFGFILVANELKEPFYNTTDTISSA